MTETRSAGRCAQKGGVDSTRLALMRLPVNGKNFVVRVAHHSAKAFGCRTKPCRNTDEYLPPIKGSDGYKAVFSWGELFNSPIGDGVIVFFERDRKSLGENEGCIAMISAKDIRTGPRHVNWLKGIEVRKIAD